MKQLLKIFSISICLLLAVACHQTKTTTVETTFEPVAATSEVETTTTKSETTESSSTDSGCSGVLSCTVDFLGDVIAFPFRLIGGVAKVIF